MMFTYIYTEHFLGGVGSATLWENVSWVKLNRYKQQHLQLKSNVYGIIQRRKRGLLTVPYTVPV